MLSASQQYIAVYSSYLCIVCYLVKHYLMSNEIIRNLEKADNKGNTAQHKADTLNCPHQSFLIVTAYTVGGSSKSQCHIVHIPTNAEPETAVTGTG